MGVKERKIRELESRKSLILNTAKELFSEKGFSNVTLDDIATAIEFSKGTIYTHFNSKEEIYALILLNHLNVLLTRLEEAGKACKDTASCIRSCLNTYIEFYIKEASVSISIKKPAASDWTRNFILIGGKISSDKDFSNEVTDPFCTNSSNSFNFFLFRISIKIIL